MSPPSEDEASDERLPRRACRGCECRRAWRGGTAGAGVSGEVEVGEAMFSGKLRLRRPRAVVEEGDSGGRSGEKNCLAWWAGERESLGRVGSPLGPAPVAETCW